MKVFIGKSKTKDKTFGNINNITYICSMIIKRRRVFPETLESETMNTHSIYNGLDYTTREINRTFKIKVNGLFNGKKINTLVGVSGLIKLVGVEMANKLLRRAFRCVKDAEHCKLRRGLKISFYCY